MSGIKFNLARFNQAVLDSRDIPFSRNCSEKISCTAKIGVIKHFSRSMHESVGCISTVRISFITTRLPLETIKAFADLKMLLPTTRSRTEAIANRTMARMYFLGSFGGRFNHIRFNLSITGKEIPLARNLLERINSNIGIGALKHFNRSLLENINVKSTLSASFTVARSALEAVNQKSVLHIYVIYNRINSENLHNLTHVSKQMHITESHSNDTYCQIYLGKRIHRKASKIAEKINASVFLSKNAGTSRLTTEAVLCITNASLTEYYFASFNISLPPGSELRINSNNFTVLLNGENAMLAHEGNWVFFDRDTIDLIIDSGTGGELGGEIIYDERFI